MATTSTSAPPPLATNSSAPPATAAAPPTSSSPWSSKYRGATVEDLDPPPALSCKPHDSISSALMNAYERDYTHLTVVAADTRALLGYLSIPRLKELLKEGRVSERDPVEKAMQRFRRRGRVYTIITLETPLEELENFFEGRRGSGAGGEGGGNADEELVKQDFAVVTDWSRRFVMGVATKWDLEEFARRRPA